MIAMKIKIIIAACVATLLLPSCGTFKTLVESAVVVGGEHLLRNYGDNSTQQIIDNYRTWAEEWNDSHPDSLGVTTSLTHVIFEELGVSSANIALGEQWTETSNKYEQMNVAKELLFDALGEVSGNNRMFDIFRQQADMDLNMLSDISSARDRKEIQAALDERNLQYFNLLYDTYQQAKSDNAAYMAEKLGIKKELMASGYDDPDLALEVAGSILAIRKSSDFTEAEKQSLIEAYGLGSYETVVSACVPEPENDPCPVETEHVVEVPVSAPVTEPAVNEIPARQVEMTYKVQVLARRSPLCEFAAYFSKTYGIDDIEEHKFEISGSIYYQYVTVADLRLSEAVRLRNEYIGKGISDAWIVGYKGAERVLPPGEKLLKD